LCWLYKSRIALRWSLRRNWCMVSALQWL